MTVSQTPLKLPLSVTWGSSLSWRSRAVIAVSVFPFCIRRMPFCLFRHDWHVVESITWALFVGIYPQTGLEELEEGQPRDSEKPAPDGKSFLRVEIYWSDETRKFRIPECLFPCSHT